MSEFAEVDKLIEEHEIFRSNMRWSRNEKFFINTIRYCFCLSVAFLGYVAFGVFGLFGSVLFWPIAKGAFPDPIWRDPFKRYNHK